MAKYIIVYGNRDGSARVAITESTDVRTMTYIVKMTAREFDTKLEAVAYLMKVDKKFLAPIVRNAIDVLLSNVWAVENCLDVQ
jgi:hypothetical protein